MLNFIFVKESLKKKKVATLKTKVMAAENSALPSQE